MTVEGRLVEVLRLGHCFACNLGLQVGLSDVLFRHRTGQLPADLRWVIIMFGDIFKEIAVEFIKWAAVGIITWLAAKLPGIRSQINRAAIRPGAVFWIAIAIAFAGFVSSAASIFYTSQRFQELAGWVGVPLKTTDLNVGGGTQPLNPSCPDGYYVVAAKFTPNSAPPYCIGCFVGVPADLPKTR